MTDADALQEFTVYGQGSGVGSGVKHKTLNPGGFGLKGLIGNLWLTAFVGHTA